MGDTDAALNSLFGEAGNLQQYETLGDDEGADKGPMGMDDMAVAEAADEADRRQEEEGLNEDVQKPSSGKAGISTDPTGPADQEAPAAKRKATSRANMLARGGACDYCKKRKLKCSAELPRCAACARADRECVYNQKQQKSRVRILEDRLAELEKKLSNERGGEGEEAAVPQVGVMESYPDSVYAAINASAVGVGSGSGSGTFISPMTHAGDGDDGFTYSDVGLTSGMDLGFSLDYMGGGSGKDMEVEPDLMTLADAATHDRIQAGGKYPWDGMTADRIVSEILAVVGGGKGVGEKIVLFL